MPLYCSLSPSIPPCLGLLLCAGLLVPLFLVLLLFSCHSTTLAVLLNCVLGVVSCFSCFSCSSRRHACCSSRIESVSRVHACICAAHAVLPTLSHSRSWLGECNGASVLAALLAVVLERELFAARLNHCGGRHVGCCGSKRLCFAIVLLHKLAD